MPNIKPFALALGGLAAGIGSEMLMPEEAEAAKWKLPIGSGIGGTIKSKGEGLVKSSTSTILEGMEAMGKTIAGVFKGKGDNRILRFTDGTDTPVHKSFVRELTAELKTQQRISEFGQMSPELQQDRAFRSLKFHADRYSPFIGKGQKRDLRQSHEQLVKQLGHSPSDYAYIKYIGNEPKWANMKLYMPRTFAEILEEMGMVNILE